MTKITFEAAAQGLCTVRVDGKHVASIARTNNGRWQLYAVTYVNRRPEATDARRVDVTNIYHQHDNLAEAVESLLAS